MKRLNFCAIVFAVTLALLSTGYGRAEANFTLAYISDSPSSSVPFWIAKDTGLKMIREQPEKVMAFVKAMAEAVHFYKNNKEEVIKIMQKYTRGQDRKVLEGAYAAYDKMLVKDTHPTMEGLQNTLDVQAAWDPKAAGAKAQNVVDLRFVKDLKKSGFIAKLYDGSQQARSNR